MGSSIGRWLDATGTADHLRTTLDSAADLTPDTSASMLRIAKRTGVPAHVVESDLDGFRRDTERVADPLQFTTKAPKIAAWLAESPYHAAAARDDLEQLAQLEDVVRGAGFFRNLGKGLGTGAVALEGGVGNVLEAAGRSVPESGGPGTLMVSGFATIAKGLGGLLKRDAEENREFYTPRVASYQGVSSGGDLRDYLAFQLGQGAGSMLAVAGGFFTGGPAGAVAVGGTMAFGDVREEIAELDADAQESVKNALALALAVPIAALDRITPGQIASKLLARGAAESVVREAAQYGMTRQVAGAVLKSAVTEGGTEVGQEIIQYLGTRAGTGTPMSAEEGGVRAMDAFIGGALGGGAFSASVEVPRVRQAMRNQRFFQRLGEVAGQSKLAQRLPEAMEQVVQQMTADGPVETVYADAQQWTAYFQGIGLDPAQVADDVIGEGGRAWYEEAVATGGRLAIPTSRYAVTLAPSEHHGALMPDLAFDPDELTAREAEQVAKQVMAESEQPAAEQGDTTPEVEQVLAERLAQTGRYRPEDAAVLAQQMGAFLRTVGQRVGQEPMALLERFGLAITDGSQPTEAAPDAAQVTREGEAMAAPYRVPDGERDHAARTEAGAWVYARSKGGTLRDVTKVSDEGLVHELLRLLESNSDDAGPAAGELRQDENYHTSDKGVVFVNTERGMKAAGRMASRNKSVAKLNAELQRRGLTDDQVGDLMLRLALGSAPSDDLFQREAVTGEDAARMMAALSGSGFAIGESAATVIVPPGQRIAGADDTVTMMRRAMQQVGAERFRRAASLEIERRGVKGDVDGEKAAVEQTARRITASPQEFYQAAYHGSPHIFDKFSLHAIGTGEGAQAYGWGLYFAGRKEIAEYYRDALAGREYLVDGAPVTTDSDAVREAMADVARLGHEVAASAEHIVNLRAQWGGLITDEYVAEFRSAVESLRGKSVTEKPGGRLYKVEIPEDDTMLLWDRPLSEQPEVVKQALASDPTLARYLDNPKMTGEKLYRYLSEDVGPVRAQSGNYVERSPDQRAASTALAAVGINGIKYLDGSSRSQGEGSYNYVIFDDQLVQITEYEQRGPDGARGRMRIDARTRQMAIDLFDSANFSTFLHESGHFYLEVLRDLSGESEQLAADAQAILKFLGVQQFSEIQREHHEQFARAMEAYFMEGNAPSVQLRRAFYRFKLWLQTLYRSVSTLDVTLTREIRDVFDRLFASEAEIDAAENEAGVVPIFTTAKDAGMSETEFAAYRQTVEDAHREASERLTTKLMGEMQREQEAWWQEQRAQVRAEVEAEIDQQPVYQALQALQRGVTVDGATIKIKLDKADLVARKGKDFLKALPRPYVYAQDGGLNADAVAEQFGFSSGDELLQALAGATPRPQAIEAETDRRMTERHGNMRVDGSIADEAELAVMDDHRDKIIRAELRALNALARTVKPHVQAERAEQRQRREQGRQILAGVPSEESTKRIAQARIAMLRVRDIKPYPYWVAARKASKQAQDALANQDYVATANAKQAELLNLALYREAQRVLAEVDSVATYARRLQQPASQRRIGKAGADYLDQINKLLERFDFRPLSNVGIDRRASLAAFIKREEEAGREVLIPEELVNEAFKKPWRMMTPEELLGIRDVLRHVEHLARTKNRLLAERAERELNEAAATLSASITAHAKRELPVDLEPRLPGTERTRTVADFFASHRKLSSLVREMDGHQDGGAMWDLILRPLNEAADQHAVMQQAINGKLWGLFEGAYSKAEMAAMYRKEYQPPIKASLSKMARLMVALNWGALDNREKLLAGLQQQHPQITAADIEAIIDTLDKRDMDFVQGVWDLMDEYWPPMKALMEQMDGVAAEKIPAAEVVTRHGTYRGGYFRLKYDSRISKRAGVHEAMTEASKLVRGAAMRASTKAGSRNERVNVSDQFVRLDFGVIFEHFEEVALDLTHTAPLYDVNRLLNHDAVWGAIGTHYGDVVRNQIKNTLTDIAAGDVPAKDGVDKALNWVRSGSSIAAMGWNMMTAAIQVTGYTQSVVRLGGDQGGVAGARWMWKGLSRWLRDPRTMNDTVTMIHEKSAFMRLRGTTQMREIREIQGKLGMRTGKLATWMDLKLDAATAGKVDMQTVQDSFFWFIAKMQMAVDVPTWLGAYEKAMADPANDEARAIALADQAVIDSQTSGLIKDLAGVQRGPAWKKLWTNFYSFFSAAYNLNVEAVARTKFTDPASVGRLTVDLMLINILPAVLGKAIRDALRGNDDEDEPEAYAREVLGFFAGQLLLLRELGGAINGFAGYEGPAGARFFSELNKLAGQLQQGDIDRALARAANQTAGILFHYPATFVQRIGDGLMAMQSGITSSPTALLFGPPRQ